MKKSAALLIAFAAVVLIILAGRFFFSSGDFMATNPSWNGMMGLTMSKDIKPLTGAGMIDSLGDGSTILIVYPRIGYDDEESGDIRSFMERGGTVIVADDYGASNTLLTAIESPAKLRQEPLCQISGYYIKKSFPVITNIIPSSVTSNVASIVLNHPVSVDISGGAAPLAFTSGSAWLDLNDNARVDGEEIMGRHCVMASAAYGEGSLIVIGDSDVFINSMQDKGDNGVLVSNLLSSTDLYLDTGHGGSLPPLALLYMYIRFDIVAQLSCAALILAGGYALINRKRLIGTEKKPGKAVADDPVSKESIISYMIANKLLKDKDIKELYKKI